MIFRALYYINASLRQETIEVSDGEVSSSAAEPEAGLGLKSSTDLIYRR